MSDNELLSAIGEMMNKNTKVLEYRMDSMENSLNDRMDSLEQRLNDKIDCEIREVKNEIREVENRIDGKLQSLESRLQNEIHKINLKLENNIEPRLQQIEACYTSTYERYKMEVERSEKMQMDIEILQDVVKEHGEAIKSLTA